MGKKQSETGITMTEEQHQWLDEYQFPVNMKLSHALWQFIGEFGLDKNKAKQIILEWMEVTL